jgi:hypothetical protein
MATLTDIDQVGTFIERMHADLREDEQKGVRPPLERRKLRTILADCGKRGSAGVLAEIEARLTEAGIYTEPRLADAGLRLGDWVWLSTGPFPPDSALFPKESDLQRFVLACLGSGAFRNLELYKGKGGISGREFRLPDGRRIDLLCQERKKGGSGDLVVIELKREHERGTVEQVTSYVDALQELYPSRKVRAIIISGREEQVASVHLAQFTQYDIRWLCYHVTFKELAKSS